MVFSVVDASHGVWQVQLEEESSELCTFNTLYGRYLFLPLPFGTSSAPEVFQKYIAQRLEGLEGVVKVVDDIWVWGEDEKQQDMRRRALMERIRSINLKLNTDKCRFRKMEITYVGHILPAEAVKPDKEKVRAIQEMPEPEDKAGLLRFLGMLQYLAKFVPNLSDVSAPLRKRLEGRSCQAQKPQVQSTSSRAQEPLATHVTVKTELMLLFVPPVKQPPLRGAEQEMCRTALFTSVGQSFHVGLAGAPGKKVNLSAWFPSMTVTRVWSEEEEESQRGQVASVTSGAAQVNSELKPVGALVTTPGFSPLCQVDFGPKCVSGSDGAELHLRRFTCKHGRHTSADQRRAAHREEGDPPSKGAGTKAQRYELQPQAPGPGPGPGPGPSCVSLKSDRSMWRRIDFRGGAESSGPRIHQEPEESGLCCDSLKSHVSKGLVIDFKAEESPEEREDHQSSELLSGQQHPDSARQRLEEKFLSYVSRVWRLLSPDEPEPPETEEEEQWRSIREEFLKITVHLLRNMEEEDLAQRLWSRSGAGACAGPLKRSLQKKFHSVSEGVARAGNSAPLNQIYTELYITEGGTEQVNQEHEVRQIEAATRQQTRPGTTIRAEDLFKASPDTEPPIRSLLTKGVAGIGKTLLTQKLTLDWAEDKAHHNFQLLFPFTFRELNLLKEKQLSLVELVHRFFPETKDSGLSSFEGVQVLFILDGLDECRLPLDFNSRVLTEATESTSVDVLLTNLIRGKLLPSAQLWITTRPAAANQIPPECVDMVTEVRGFTDLQKEEYFRKRFRRKKQTTVMSHIRSSRSLYIMCHIPIFCWITATVLEDMLKSRETGELPKTLTEMYIHFLVVQAKVKKLKYHGGAGTDPVWDPESRKMVKSLGKLAFEQLQRGNLIFYESDLTECGMDITAAALYSGVFTQIFREERGLYQDKVFCFIHLSLQEFLAALHVHLKFFNSGVNLLDSQKTSKLAKIFGLHIKPFYQTAINEAVESPNGHLDLFLRFLLGLSLQTSQRLLPGLLTQTGSSSWTHQDTAELIKEKISEKVSPERIINLFHCLSETEILMDDNKHGACRGEPPSSPPSLMSSSTLRCSNTIQRLSSSSSHNSCQTVREAFDGQESQSSAAL
ncbi:uncharacterized protein LOC128771803 [Synchiropus splendidus]|uniref:uncharacterized protein LOC128771803 n=1 Tax=Synchiropus splendidus TaxID=270530 RepID=UPI00237E0F80|nr:uncharacterized protein LOC128771803 [Synchiropus splendidus]